MSVTQREAQNISNAQRKLDTWLTEKALPKLRRRAVKQLSKGSIYFASIRIPLWLRMSPIGDIDGPDWIAKRSVEILNETYPETHVAFVDAGYGDFTFWLSVQLAHT